MTRVILMLVGCALLALPASASAGWERARPFDTAGAALSRSGEVADITVDPSGTATLVFFNAAEDTAYFARRPAGAASWGEPHPVPFPAGTGAARSTLEANRAGDTLALWGSGALTRPAQAAWWGASASTPGAAAPTLAGGQPQVGIDGAANAYAVTRGQLGQVIFMRFDAATGTWSAPREIATGLAFDSRPDIAVSEAGEAVVLYSKQVGTFPNNENRLYARTLRPGESDFTPEQVLDAPGDSVGGIVDAVVDSTGTATAVYTEGSSVTRGMAVSWRAGGEPKREQLSSPREASYPVTNPSVVVDRDGRVTAAWLQQEGKTFLRLYSAERPGDGGFSFPQRVSPSNEHLTDDGSSEPPSDVSPEGERSVNNAAYDLAVDDEGTATIVYTDSDDGFGFADPDVKATRRASGGTWTEPVSLVPADSDKPVNGTARPQIASVRPGQVDAVFVQNEPQDDDFDQITLTGPPILMTTRFEGPPPPSGQRQTMVRSFDGTGILVQWCPAAGPEPGERAPTVIAGSGWGIPGRRCAPAEGEQPEERAESVFGSTSVETLTNAGYNVLTFDARGFWRSGGVAQVDDPRYEGRDMQALIDFVATQPGALLDGPGDPRLGMSGGSYGGGIQLVTAALDRRVDAIAPSIAWNSLVTSLFPRESVKAGWASILVGAGTPMSALPGVLSPDGIETGTIAEEVFEAVGEGARGGTIDAETRAWFADRGPDALLSRVQAPTLLVQGIQDTLFPLDEAHRNFEALQGAGTEVSMLWFCGGHGLCQRQGADQQHVDQRVLAWFDRHLRGLNVATGPAFEWVDEDGRWHESASYPPAQDGVVRGTGSGTLSLAPGEFPGSGIAILATPYSAGSSHPAAVDVPIEHAPEGSTLVGAPQLTLAYTATGESTYGTGVDGATPQQTHVYAQIVDNLRNVVVANQVTPVPITLDGQEHTISLPLERIASRSGGGRYSLQIVPQSSVYDGQRAGGQVAFRSIEVTLPVDRPGEGSAAAAQTGGGGAAAAPRRPRARRCRGLRATITGTARRDVIRGTARRDVIVARGGDDRIRGRGRRDVICAGAGNDVVYGGRGDDVVDGGRGRDALYGDRGDDRLFGGPGADRLTGGRGRDRLSGGIGRDLLIGDPRRDRLLGGPGRDRIR